MQTVDIDVRWNSVQVLVNGEINTKVCVPPEAEIKLHVQPSLLGYLENLPVKVIDIVEVAQEYRNLLLCNGTLEDLKAFCGVSELAELSGVLRTLNDAYFSEHGIKLQSLSKKKRIKRVVFTLDSVQQALRLLP